MNAPPKTVALPFAAEVGDLASVKWPVLYVALDWIEAHCVIPDGFLAGRPYVLAPWQAWFYANHYRVRPDATLTEYPDGSLGPTGAPAFHYRRSQLVLSQKAGKGPLTASQCCLEAVGPALFAGWAEAGDIYRCSDYGCFCGWEYPYDAGEAMGAPWSTPLIQVTAFSEEQAGNVYDALRAMIDKGVLRDIDGVRTGEEFIKLPNGGRVDRVTSSPLSRLGQRVTFVPQDETGLWTKQNKMIKVADTQRRGAAGMQGRTVETTNAWDPAEESVAQLTAQAAIKTKDIFRLHPQGPAGLRYGDKRQRRVIHGHVYTGSWWINLDSIEGEAFELLERDAAQAERFYGNRIVAGAGAWMDMDLWGRWARPNFLVAEGTEVCGGFDGSESDDWTAIRLETRDGHRFTPLYGPDRQPAHWNPKEHNGSIPRDQVDTAMEEIARRYRLRRFYADPKDWETEIGNWSLLYGEEVVFEWATYRITDMHKALVQAITDLREGRNTHDGDETAALHLSNARKVPRPQDRYILGKPDQHRKIDIAMADTLAHRAAADLRAEGWVVKANALTRATGRARSY